MLALLRASNAISKGEFCSLHFSCNCLGVKIMSCQLWNVGSEWNPYRDFRTRYQLSPVIILSIIISCIYYIGTLAFPRCVLISNKLKPQPQLPKIRFTILLCEGNGILCRLLFSETYNIDMFKGRVYRHPLHTCSISGLVITYHKVR